MIKLPIKRHFLIDVPMDAYDIELRNIDDDIWLRFLDYRPVLVRLEKGNYRLISDNIANITEEQAKGIVGKCECGGPCINYKDYSEQSSCDTALQSLYTAFKSVGVVWRNGLPEPKGIKCCGGIMNDCGCHGALQYDDEEVATYATAQSLVKRFVLIEKEGRDGND
jgi:hypothetical protein